MFEELYIHLQKPKIMLHVPPKRILYMGNEFRLDNFSHKYTDMGYFNKRLATILVTLTCLTSCGNAGSPSKETNRQNKAAATKIADLQQPADYQKVSVVKGSFAEFLRNLPLKPRGSDLHYYNGQIKKSNYKGSIVDVDFGYRSDEQCADAIIYLRALWLWKTKQYEKIHFNFTNGFKAEYSRWMKGDRIIVNKKNWHCSYKRMAHEDISYPTFRKYLNMVFTYAGTASLEKELASITDKELQIGDVIINGGFPGHTVLVVDKAKNKEGKTAYLLAQGFTPAQEIEVFATWFEIDPQSGYLSTPEWIFKGKFAKRFR